MNARFGKLTTIKRIKKDSRWYWDCLCDCGNTRTVRQTDLKSNKVKYEG